MNEHLIIETINKKIIETRNHFNNVIKNEKKASIIYISPVNYFFLRKNINILLEISHVYIDTIILSTLISFLIKKITRLSMDLQMCISDLLNFAIKENKSIFFIGGTQKEIEIFISKMNTYFPKLKIAGYTNGFKSDDEIINEINKTKEKIKIDFVLIGLGNKRQESFIYKLKKINPNLFLISCGAFITQTANSREINFYPNFVYRHNLRWFYRMLKEPRILVRIIIIYPIFLTVFFKDFFVNKFKK